MKKLLFVLMLLSFAFSGCTKEEYVRYDLAICDFGMNTVCEYMSGFESENFRVMNTEFSDEQLDIVIKALNASNEGLESITVYSKNVSVEYAEQFISFAKTKEIPIVFVFSAIDDDILTEYDKAFCITTNYSHAAEELALKVDKLWENNEIIDVDTNMIFSFSVIFDDIKSENTESFYNCLTYNMELYGIPMQVKNSLTVSDLNNEEVISSLKNSNEGFIVLADELLPYYGQYAPAGEGFELITLTEGIENPAADYPFVISCFIDYKDYKLASDEILRGYRNKEFPLDSVTFPYINRTVFIPAHIN